MIDTQRHLPAGSADRGGSFQPPCPSRNPLFAGRSTLASCRTSWCQTGHQDVLSVLIPKSDVRSWGYWLATAGLVMIAASKEGTVDDGFRLAPRWGAFAEVPPPRGIGRVAPSAPGYVLMALQANNHGLTCQTTAWPIIVPNRCPIPWPNGPSDPSPGLSGAMPWVRGSRREFRRPTGARETSATTQPTRTSPRAFVAG
jgi:hypothetical protein